MYLIWILSCLVFVAISGSSVPKCVKDFPDLKWPKKYSFKAFKTSMTAGWVEDISFWRNNLKSRVVYNQGAVRVYTQKSHRCSDFPYGVKFTIYPVTTKDELNSYKCTRVNGTIFNRIKITTLLPDESTFKRVGCDYLDQTDVTKFAYNEVKSDKDYREILWASYNSEINSWIPIRYESIVYSMWLDTLEVYNIWDFYNFDVDFDDGILDVEQYDCEDSNESISSYTSTDKHVRNIDPENEDLVNHFFNAFKQKHKKKYVDEKENEMRKRIFHERVRLVYENNRKNTGYTLTINKFADRTPEEMKRSTGLVRPSIREKDTHPFPYTKSEIEDIGKNLPKQFDLRNLGVITPVRDQEECGSCWSFGTTNAVEGVLARKNGGRLLRLANQALIDCAWGFGVAGCDGGYDIGAYRWMMEYGLPTEEEYGPYQNNDGFCHIDNMTMTYPILGFTNVTPFSVDALKVALVNHGPVSASIDALDDLFLYNGGIFYDIRCDPTKLNHEISVVGYGVHEGEEYWIVKNSWGQGWGIDGYFYISMRDNNCGITTEATYVVV